MKLIFAGTPQNSALSLELIAEHHEIVLVITRPDAEVGRKRVLTPSPVALKAQELGIEVIKTTKFTAEINQQISNSEAEIGVVVAFGAIIPASTLQLLPWWNLHFSLLPKWRGATPLQHSILHNGDGAGVSVFEIEKGLDTGRILASKPIELLANETTSDALPRFTTIGTELLLSALNELPAGVEQTGEISLAPKFDREAARLNWAKTSAELASQIRAMNPEPMAWCILEDQPFRILRATVANPEQDGHELGLVSGKARVQVSCGGNTSLELIEIQPAGKKPMAAIDWYRGLNKEVKLG